jgi:hypothetical protein
VDGEASGKGDVFGQGAGAGWEGVAGGEHGDDFVAFAKTSLGGIITITRTSSSITFGMGMPDVLDDAR